MLESIEKSDESFKKNEFKYKSLFKNMKEGFTYNQIIFDEEGRIDDFIILETNEEFLKITGLKENEIINKKISELGKTLGTNKLNWNEDIAKEILKNNNIKIDEFYFEIKNKWFSISAYSLFDNHFAMIISDITEKKIVESKIFKMAYYDSLTNLPNRKLFFDRLEMTFAHSKRNNTMFALLFIDLDNFKKINDFLGHSKGDELLKETANRIKKAVRDTDTVSRFGGDEFTIIMDSIKNYDDASILADRILKSVHYKYNHNNEEICVTASIGISVYPYDDDNIEGLINKVNQAMYKAKKNGKGKANYFQKNN